MRFLRLALALLVSCGMLVTVGTAPAVACSCAWSKTRTFVENADQVVAGTLTQLEEPPPRLVTSSGDPVTYTVAVDAVYKGNVSDEVVFESARDGASCGLEGMSVNLRYVVFLTVSGDTRHASLCGGTAYASPALESAVERLTGPPSRPASEPDVEQASGLGPPGVRTDDDLPASSALPMWILGAGAFGLAVVVGGGLWLRRRAG